MPTIEELKDLYSKKSDAEIVQMFYQIKTYSDDAQKAIDSVIHKKGGIIKIKERVQIQLDKDLEFSNETNRISKLVSELFEQNKSIEEIMNAICSDLLDNNTKEIIINNAYTEIDRVKADINIRPRSIIGSLIGGLLGGTISGILWGVQMIYSAHVFMIFAFGVVMICYASIRLFSRQSKRNIIVLIVTILSSIYAIFLGEMLYNFFGYLGDH